MNYVNAKARALKPSETLAVKARANELKAQGRKIIDLSTGEPDIDTPEHIKEGARRALAEGKTKYTEVAGIKELREAIAHKLVNENGIECDPSRVIVTNGGKQALEELFKVVLEPGDEVVIPAPYWVSYPPMVELAGGTPVIVNARPENGFKLTPEELASVLSPRTKCVVINSPSNPTGAAYSASELRALGSVLERTDALIVSDEVYEKVVFGGFSFVSVAAALPSLRDRVVTVNAFSKSYSMTGWRVGYAAGPKEIISAMARYQSQSTSNVCAPAQYAALAALAGPHDFLKGMLESFDRRIHHALSLLERAPGLRVMCKPEGAFYLFVRFEELARGGRPEAKSSGVFVNHLLESAGVAAVPGEAFGDPYAFRISVAAADSAVAQGVEQIADAAARLAR